MEIDDCKLGDWTFEESALDPEHFVCLAINRKSSEWKVDKFEMMNFDDLVEDLPELESDLNSDEELKIFRKMENIKPSI